MNLEASRNEIEDEPGLSKPGSGKLGMISFSGFLVFKFFLLSSFLKPVLRPPLPRCA